MDEAPYPYPFAVLEPDQVGIEGVDLHAACGAVRVYPADSEDLIAEDSGLGDVELEIREGLEQFSNRLARPLPTPIHRRFASQQLEQSGMPLHRGVELLQQPVKVSAGGRLNRSSGRLGGLPRHRPPRISQALPGPRSIRE